MYLLIKYIILSDFKSFRKPEQTIFIHMFN